METKAAEVLQVYGIDVAQDDQRMPADILQDYTDKGLVSGLSDVKICIEALDALRKMRMQQTAE